MARHNVLDQLHSKTEAGRAEIRARALPLSRAARNLLLVLDASKTAGDWLRLVAGATEADLTTLRQHGLIAPQGAGGPPPVATTAPAAPAAIAAPPAGGAPLLDRAALYAYLSGEATKLLGPFKGYAFALEVERADSLAALQALALQLVERVQKAKGEDAAAAVREALGLR
ncbi:hypothetical protein [Pelomonas aquatica]|jgi:hypothetical protein|uniref:Uncharacterized protein n=1 Tax=Pelomonas aquatica TaxID=431058 RepID=A0A9X4R6U4_9BURK|nr:hypothetical protein [Pelomonas aquatica]MCY4755808.1 hypothetical protein [Pelomonas aquatica]MDG0865166.1 hypothetical protein [Pelomonas aquatica]